MADSVKYTFKLLRCSVTLIILKSDNIHKEAFCRILSEEQWISDVVILLMVHIYKLVSLHLKVKRCIYFQMKNIICQHYR